MDYVKFIVNDKVKIQTNIATKDPVGFIYVSPNVRCQGTKLFENLE